MREITLSALQHYAFCPRQCALIHNEQAWAENFLTAQGRVLHERVDGGEPETRKGVRFELPPFSVCEAAALLGASQIFPAGTPRLLLPKTTVLGQLTMSIALARP